MKKFGIGLLVVVLLVVLWFVGFGSRMLDQSTEGFFKKRGAKIEREVFKENTSYQESKARDLADYRLQWKQADEGDKDDIIETIRLMYSDFNPNDLESDTLARFLTQVQEGEL